MPECPTCDEFLDEFDSDDYEIGDVVTCPERGEDLEVIDTDPLEFDVALFGGDDDDDYCDDDDDYYEEEW